MNNEPQLNFDFLNTIERWGIVPLYPDYKGSTYGRIMSFNKRGCLNKKVNFFFLKTTNNRLIYPQVHLVNNKGIKRFIVHRIIGLLFVPNPLNLPEINHKDLNKKNNHVDNLEWVTEKENINHASLNGKRKFGQDCKYSKLTDRKVRNIRKLYIPKKNGLKKLAKQYKVSESTIYRIVARKKWKHLI